MKDIFEPCYKKHFAYIATPPPKNGWQKRKYNKLPKTLLRLSMFKSKKSNVVK